MSKGWQCRTYYNVNPFVGISIHDTMGVLPAPPFFGPTKLPHIEFSVVQGLWLGSSLSKRSKKAVISEGLLFVGRMSDAGFIVPHISIPPSWYNLLTTLFGSSNCLFGASSVQVACKNLLWGNQDCDIAATPFGPVPFSINLCCWDPISIPTDLVVVWGSVYVGMTWDDIAAAAIDFAISVATEVAAAVAGKALSAGWTKAKGMASKMFKTSSEGMSSATQAFARNAQYMKGVKYALDATDDDIAQYVASKSGKEGVDKSYSSAMKQAAGQLDDNADVLIKEYDTSLWRSTTNGQWTAGFEAVEEVLEAARKADVSTAAAKQLALGTVGESALRNLDDSMAALVTKWAAWEVGTKLAQKTASKALWSHLVKQGNLFGSGTDGGIASFDGLGWTNYFHATRRWEQKYSDLGFIGDPDEEWDIAYVDSNDDDYWYSDSTATDETEADDYWFDEDDEDGDDVASDTTAATVLTAATPATATTLQVTI